MIIKPTYENLHYHLQYNLYPPITEKAIPQCQEAIEAYNTGATGRAIQFPKNITRTAEQVVSDLRLWEFVYDWE